MIAQNVGFGQVVDILEKIESEKPDSVRVTARNRAMNRSRTVTIYGVDLDGAFDKLLNDFRKHPALVLVLSRSWIDRLKSKKIKRMMKKGQLIAK